MKARTLPAGRSPSSSMDRSQILVHRGGTDPAQEVRDRIGALGVTPAQVRAWCESEGVPLPRHGVDLDAVTAFEDAHPARKDLPCPRTAPASAPTVDLSLPRQRFPSAAGSTSPTPRPARGVPTPTPGTPTMPATSGLAQTPTPTTASTRPPEGPTAAGARRAATRAMTPPAPAPLAVPIDGADPWEIAELGGVILWPHPHRYPAPVSTESSGSPSTSSTSTAPPAPNPQPTSTSTALAAATPSTSTTPAATAASPSAPDASSTACASTTSAPADLHRALAAARRLGGAGVSVRRLVNYVVEFDAALPWLPAPCIVCTRAVPGEHIARTTHAVHGDPRTRSGCWANYIEMRTT